LLVAWKLFLHNIPVCTVSRPLSQDHHEVLGDSIATKVTTALTAVASLR
jgi:hypothetical protein